MARPRALDQVRSFPWRSLQSTTRAELNALRDVRRWAAAHLRLDALIPVLEKLVGAKVAVFLGRAQSLDRAAAMRMLDDGVGVLLARADAADARGAALLEADGALAATMVSRVLGRPAPLLTKAAASSDSVAGGFAALVVAAARRCHTGIALRVLDAGRASVLEADMAASDSDLVALSLTVLLADDAFAARVVLSRGALPRCDPPAWDARSLQALGSTLLALPIVACASLMTAEEVAHLRPGDAIVPNAWPLTRADGGTLAGRLLLASATSELGLVAQLCEDGRLVLRAGLEPVVAREARMDVDERGAVVATLGEVPIVMRVEIGEAVMAAREWASLAPGDVIAVGRRVGEAVVIRIGGIAMARGELVELDGEVAVRIVERFDDRGTTA